MEVEYDGPTDDDGLPHGRGTLTMVVEGAESTVFTGRFAHGAKQGAGSTALPNGDVLRGTYEDDELSPAHRASYTYADGRALHFRDGQGVERGAHGAVTYRGGVADMVPEGAGTLFLYGPAPLPTMPDADAPPLLDGELRGEWREGVLHGAARFVYPDGASSLVGRWVEGDMYAASYDGGALAAAGGGGGGDEVPTGRAARALRRRATSVAPGSVAAATAATFRFDESTASRIARQPLLRDPYESAAVVVRPSRIPGSGEGLFARRALRAGAIAAWYNGVRTPCEEVDGRPDWDLNDNVINLDEQTAIDVPPPLTPTSAYCASLGHKANHSRANNAEYTCAFHPRFGDIKCVRTLRHVAAGEEILVDYTFFDETPPWYDASRDGLTVSAERQQQQQQQQQQQ